MDKHDGTSARKSSGAEAEYSTCGLESQVTQLTLSVQGEDCDEPAMGHRATMAGQSTGTCRAHCYFTEAGCEALEPAVGAACSGPSADSSRWPPRRTLPC